MGSQISKQLGNGEKKQQYNILLTGLMNSGKTALLYRITEGVLVPTTHTNVRDVGGIQNTRFFTPAYCKYLYLISLVSEHAKAMIYVIDSSNVQDIEKAASDIKSILYYDLKDVPLLIFANKKDVAGALSPLNIVMKLGLYKLDGRLWHIQACSAATGDGILPGLTWLKNALEKRLK